MKKIIILGFIVGTYTINNTTLSMQIGRQLKTRTLLQQKTYCHGLDFVLLSFQNDLDQQRKILDKQTLILQEINNKLQRKQEPQNNLECHLTNTLEFSSDKHHCAYNLSLQQPQ